MLEEIVVLVPTTEESEHFSTTLPHGVRVEVSGVGMAATAASAFRAVTKYNPKWLILAGIAGAYPNSELVVGDCVLVGSERVVDQGAFRDDAFKSLYANTYVCPFVSQVNCLEVVNGGSVNAAAAGFIDQQKAQLENMEGAAFFAVCIAAGVQFLEVRAVSNLTTASRDEWRMELATSVLAQGVKEVIDEIEA